MSKDDWVNWLWSSLIMMALGAFFAGGVMAAEETAEWRARFWGDRFTKSVKEEADRLERKAKFDAALAKELSERECDRSIECIFKGMR